MPISVPLEHAVRHASTSVHTAQTWSPPILLKTSLRASHEIRNVFSEVVKFECPGLVLHIMHERGWSQESAYALMKDLFLFLFLKEHVGGLEVLPPPEIEQAWRSFILLDTRAYEQFCIRRFGRSVHFKHTTYQESHPSLVLKTLGYAREMFGNNLSSNWSFHILPVPPTR